MPEPARSAQLDGSVLCLIGTSRPDGDTTYLVDHLSQNVDGTRQINIGSLTMAPYDYEHRHEADGFSCVAEAMDAARVIIFATPVYWYSMSAQMKTVFDRLSDLTQTRKEIGKRLAGKTAFAVINGEDLPEGFVLPFEKTAGYFNMRWGGALTLLSERGKAFADSAKTELAAFADMIADARDGKI